MTAPATDVLVIGAGALQFSTTASGDDGWVTLLDSSKKGDWDEVGKANWAMKDGALVNQIDNPTRESVLDALTELGEEQ